MDWLVALYTQHGMNPRILIVSAASVVLLTLVATVNLSAQRIPTVPATTVPQSYLGTPQTRRLPNVTHLRKPQPAAYSLDSGDTLSIFIDGVLGPLDSHPPVQSPQPGNDLPPSLGYPIVVRENGQIDLPYIEPLNVRGLTIEQTRSLLEKRYQEGEEPILKPGKNRILVSLMRKRTYRVTVIRQDQNRSQRSRNAETVARLSDQSATGSIINLPAGENDVLNALIRTGGFPGVNEKSDIRVQRTDGTTSFVRNIRTENRSVEFPRSSQHRFLRPNYAPSINVPTRLAPGRSFDNRRSELQEGDVLYVESRKNDVYYTGGLLNGGQFLLPRDTDLDVLEAVAIAGRTPANRSSALATELVVLRRLPGNRQIPIRVDLNRALTDPRQRLQVVSGDILILRYRSSERLLNLGSAVFNTYGLGRFGR